MRRIKLLIVLVVMLAAGLGMMVVPSNRSRQDRRTASFGADGQRNGYCWIDRGRSIDAASALKCVSMPSRAFAAPIQVLRCCSRNRWPRLIVFVFRAGAVGPSR